MTSDAKKFTLLFFIFSILIFLSFWVSHFFFHFSHEFFHTFPKYPKTLCQTKKTQILFQNISLKPETRFLHLSNHETRFHQNHFSFSTYPESWFLITLTMNHDFITHNHFSKCFLNLKFPKPNKIIPKIVLKPIIALNLRSFWCFCSVFLLFSYFSSSFSLLLPSSYLLLASFALFNLSNGYTSFFSLSIVLFSYGLDL